MKVKCVLSSLTGLQTLNLSHNSISDAGAASLACVLSSLTGLQTLDLRLNSISDAGAASLACVLSWAATVVTTSSWCSLDTYGLGNQVSHNFSAFKRKKMCDTRAPLPRRHPKHNYRPHGRRAEVTGRFTPTVSRHLLAETTRAVIYHFKIPSYHHSPRLSQYHPPFVNLQVQYQCRGKTRTVPP